VEDLKLNTLRGTLGAFEIPLLALARKRTGTMHDCSTMIFGRSSGVNATGSPVMM